jgi:SH3 domain protein
VSASADALTAERNALQTQLETLRGELGSNLESLDSTAEELERIQQLSGNAVQLDQQNRRLIEEVELMHTSIEMLEAENRRLQDTRDQEAFMNGAMAVLLGVVIALVVPRLWPRRRRDSGWA